MAWGDREDRDPLEDAPAAGRGRAATRSTRTSRRALAALTGAPRPPRRAPPAVRRHGGGQDGGVPGRGQARCSARGEAGAGAGARDRADAAARGPVPGAVRRRRGRVALGADRRGPPGGSGAGSARARRTWRSARGARCSRRSGALGLVVVDEEHDDSYKQDEGVPYHARDLAVKLGSTVRLPGRVGLGHALARELAERCQRALPPAQTPPPGHARPVPTVELVDMTACPSPPDGPQRPCWRRSVERPSGTRSAGRAGDRAVQPPRLRHAGAVHGLRRQPTSARTAACR
jgi:hypothetical protein